MKMEKSLKKSAAMAALLAMMYGAVPADDATKQKNDNDRAEQKEQIQPRREPLAKGEAIPDVTLVSETGKEVSLRKAVAEKPAVLVFYRGGWCPYCNVHLADLRTVEADLNELGYQVLAISPDSPEELTKTREKGEFSYELLSDADLNVARQFGLSFQLEPDLVEKYKGYGIDLQKASGGKNKKNELPVPAVFIVDRESKVQYAYTNPDYKVRLSGEEVLAAAKAAAK